MSTTEHFPFPDGPGWTPSAQPFPAPPLIPPVIRPALSPVLDPPFPVAAGAGAGSPERPAPTRPSLPGLLRQLPDRVRQGEWRRPPRLGRGPLRTFRLGL